MTWTLGLHHEQKYWDATAPTGLPLAEGADVVTGSGACTMVRGSEMTSLEERRRAAVEERIRATSEGQSWFVDVVPLLPSDDCTAVLDE